MSPNFCTCAICGWLFNSSPPSWSSEFRGLVTDIEDGVEGPIVITGLGIYDDPDLGGLIPPSDPNATYHDEGFDIMEEDWLTLYRRHATGEKVSNGKRGFAIHDACWQLLGETMSPEPVPLDRVFQVLDSLPTDSMRGTSHHVDWGEGYGVDDDEYFPWQNCSRLQRDHEYPPFNADPIGMDLSRDTHAARKARENREHILKRVGKLVNRIKLDRRGFEQPLVSPWDKASSLEDQRRVRVAGCVENVDLCRAGCREFFHQRISIPEDISKVSVSLVEAGTFSFISGISLSTSSGQTITLGHVDPNHGNEEENCTHLSPPGLKGFNIAVGLCGIHAIQCVGSSEVADEWLGSPTNAPITRRLGTGNGILALRCGFDGFRLIDVAAVLKDGGVTPNRDDVANPDRPLRNAGLWYPHAPPDQVKLNGGFHQLAKFVSGFRPMQWTQFGGPGGIYLKNLTKITFQDFGRFVFEYDSDGIPEKCRMFGRAHKTKSRYQQRIEFAIDGPGGERIIAITIRHRHSVSKEDRHYVEEVLGSLEITTSHGKRFYFAIDDKADKYSKVTLKESKLSVEKGDVITGFYGAQNDWSRIEALGIMTESGN
ncbi:hypothetical protein QBC40DRAFT_24008 [Triangularia verruculosa]|uniref:DUF7600 domain-containing protein n=1 Tax=Triangularia verruculosa TaxID=2587418 RepID=A0AAN7AXM9_9PEZI|nr:hypothetical protein QBC40DRAFT_24008 [Triangularia verruculosa]